MNHTIDGLHVVDLGCEEGEEAAVICPKCVVEPCLFGKFAIQSGIDMYLAQTKVVRCYECLQEFVVPQLFDTKDEAALFLEKLQTYLENSIPKGHQVEVMLVPKDKVVITTLVIVLYERTFTQDRLTH